MAQGPPPGRARGSQEATECPSRPPGASLAAPPPIRKPPSAGATRPARLREKSGHFHQRRGTGKRLSWGIQNFSPRRCNSPSAWLIPACVTAMTGHVGSLRSASIPALADRSSSQPGAPCHGIGSRGQRSNAAKGSRAPCWGPVGAL
jgi:hypothetical protein